MPTLGAIADDFTGATDLATMLVARGYRTVVTVGTDAFADGTGNRTLRDADAVVVALKSRTAPVEEAVGASLTALRALREAGCARYYFKYCSTFDSTPRGNIGPVADALLAELDEHRTVVVPSFPATGRTVDQGLLYVHGELLQDSPMRHHPLTPMRDSDLRRLLAPQTGHPVRLIGLDTVRAGSDALRAALDAPDLADALVVVDAVSDQDLETVCAATAHLTLVTGAAGLALGLTGPHTEAARATPASGPGDPGVVLSGSASSATRAQVAHARTRLPHRKLDVAALRTDFSGTVAGLVAFARRAWDDDPAKPPLIYAVGDLGDLEQTAPDGAPAASELVERALAACATGLVAAGARRLLVAGGETSGAVVTALGVRTLSIGAPIAPGVTWARAEGRADGRDHTVDLALKSGNFGDTAIFTEAWSALA
ncbi:MULTISPECIES: 3-oxo-tetronate kinase [Streptomyces]|uniref:3-oxo-tetronate kinase n=1 Tax=Streptomyces salyersiae TaxID=3075530 RepID=A0ABU2RG44_9ACTN|nr:3-oxo-tetronate kinase [Streptomyces sp. DSM 41770]MDT0426919.1 four-carbon acid sugar kinase family protein [Streptomyces sp. DSM 41770]